MQESIRLTRALIARFLLNQQPVAIRKRLDADEDFGLLLGLQTVQVLQIVPGVSIRHRELFSTVRKLVSPGDKTELKAVQGTRIVVERVENGITLHVWEGGKDRALRFDELMIFSSVPEERVQALNRIIEQLGATGPDRASARRVISQ